MVVDSAVLPDPAVTVAVEAWDKRPADGGRRGLFVKHQTTGTGSRRRFEFESNRHETEEGLPTIEELIAHEGANVVKESLPCT